MTRDENIARVEAHIKEGVLYASVDSFFDDAKDYLKRPITWLDEMSAEELQRMADKLDAARKIADEQLRASITGKPSTP
jgi:hypothetical protein